MFKLIRIILLNVLPDAMKTERTSVRCPSEQMFIPAGNESLIENQSRLPKQTSNFVLMHFSITFASPNFRR
jgi:hypothetical protein